MESVVDSTSNKGAAETMAIKPARAERIRGKLSPCSSKGAYAKRT